MEQPLTTNTPQKTGQLRAFLSLLGDNPVIIKELKSRMRGKQAFIIMTAYLTLLALILSVVYGITVTELAYYSINPETRQTVGKAIFGTVVILELLMIIFIGPGLTSGAISSERERQTFDLLRTTLLPARSLVFGKLWSAMTYLLLLILTALPIEGIAFILGGVGLGELLISSWMMVVTALFFCTLGMFYSSFMKRTLGSTVSSYVTILVSTILLAVSFFLLEFIGNYGSRSLDTFQENVLDVIYWTMLSSNPVIAAILSEVILIDDQSYFIGTGYGMYSSMALPSPWIVFSVLYLGISTVLLALTIHFVKKPRK
ncbi:MAG: hypothetical protein JXA13_01605 [Anaerolineales bacterium]|nr:hypothetical protein [Anaerolineales bacterium]